jgi:hypothetical protein
MKNAGFILVFLISCVQPSNANIINIGIPVEMGFIDPFNLNLLEEYEVFSSVFDSLLTRNVAEGYEPALAEKWEFDHSKKTITFHLRSNLKFSDGSDLNAEDVEASLKRLILMDKDNSLLITKCLPTNKKQFLNLKNTHPLITVLNSHTIQLGPTGCGETVLKEIGDTNYGIISKKHIQKNLLISAEAPISGPFIFTKNSNGFKLIPNKYNWRWKTANDKELVLNFQKIDQNFSQIKANKIDFFRTSNNKTNDEAILNGYNSVVSVPIMLWYLTTDGESKEGLSIVNFINQSNSLKFQFNIFKNNSLETPAESFFPPEFNCTNKDMIKTKTTKPNTKKIIHLINHKSHESDIYMSDLKTFFNMQGFQVVIDDQTNKGNSEYVNLYFKRQFYGDGIEGTLNFAFRVIKAISDPGNKVGTLLDKLSNQNLSKDSKKNLTNTICKEVHFYNHAPIAHRKYAFLYKSDIFKDVFSKGNGNLIYNRLIK